MLDAVEATAGVGAVLAIFTGAPPATCATADSGTELARMTLPSDWMGAASLGSKAKSGSWSDPAGNAAGVAGHWRIYASNGTTCHLQGTVSAPAGGGDLELNNTSIAVGQTVSITAFTLAMPNG